MLPTPVPPSPSELAIPKVLFKGKLVSGKKSNSPYFAYQRHKLRLDQAQNKSMMINEKKGHPEEGPHDDRKSRAKNSSSPHHQSSSARALFFTSFRYSLLVLALSLLVSRMITETWFWGYSGKYIKWNYYFPGPQEIFTIESLSYHDGVKDPHKPILLAIRGNVYNVDSNKNMYGPGGTYHHFVGRDASRAFVTGCFKTGLTYDLRGLSDKQKKSLDYWSNFFENSAKYTRVGRLILPELDDSVPIPKDCDPKMEGGAI